MSRVRGFAIALFFLVPAQRCQAASASDLQRFDGVWLADSATCGGYSSLQRVWNSTFTISHGGFVIANLGATDLRGTMAIDPEADPRAINLNVGEFDWSDDVKYPACVLPGIYKLDANQLTVCFQIGPDRKRPTDFVSRDEKTIVLVLRRTGVDFKGFPARVLVTVLDPGGKPALGAELFSFLTDSVAQYVQKINPTPYGLQGITNSEGTTHLPYADIDPLIAWDKGRGLIGIAEMSPASLTKGPLTIELKPQCRLFGTIVCDELAKTKAPIPWTNVYLYHQGVRIASSDSVSGRFEFLVPPGAYLLNAYGSDLRHQNVDITVPAGCSEFQAPPIPLAASRLLALEGHPAPELEGVVGWKGQPVKLADLRGQYVLVDFWGYWCWPCVRAMPVLMALHDRFAGKGLAIIGVHVDLYGEIDAAAKLDQKLVGIRARYWSGRDLPFPIALVSGEPIIGPDGQHARKNAATEYGVLGLPTTILIDRDGKVVGKFDAAGDAKMATEQMEKLLSPAGHGRHSGV
ncbi:MAG TPA: redoxin domain-containing protein [Tepidisphaeraceae bacterium]|nr:redoxin domain-containing protein [Tepidisphaeraceae bacterium]